MGLPLSLKLMEGDMKQEKEERRSFLKHILAGSTAVAAVAVTRKPVQADTVSEKRISNDVLYRETEHFKKHYQSWRS